MTFHLEVQKRSLKGDFNGEGVLYHKFFYIIKMYFISRWPLLHRHPTSVKYTVARASEVNGSKLHCAPCNGLKLIILLKCKFNDNFYGL